MNHDTTGAANIAKSGVHKLHGEEQPGRSELARQKNG